MLTAATITVTFQANYGGPHRICWRVQGSGDPYVCTNIVECLGGGNACQAVISIMVEPESCTPVTYEGYIQATCLPEASSTDRVPWSITFTPNPGCTLYTLQCTGNCSAILAADMGLNCNGTARPDVGPFTNGQAIKLCATGVIPNLPAGYTMTQDTNGCCYNCINYTVSISVNPLNPGGILDGSVLYYVNCSTRELVKVEPTGAIPYSVDICAVEDSVVVIDTAETVHTIGVGDAC